MLQAAQEQYPFSLAYFGETGGIHEIVDCNASAT